MTKRSCNFPLTITILVLCIGLAGSRCDDGGETACVPGAQENCGCLGGAIGIQVCADDGESFGVCDCSVPDGDSDVDGDGDIDGDVDSDGDIDGDGFIDGDVDADDVGEWVLIRAGSFTMGTPVSEIGYDPNAGELQHQVTLTRDFEMMTTEVTQAQFSELMGYGPSYDVDCGADCPVEQVNWHEAAAYCNTLSGQSGLDRCYLCRGLGSSVYCDPAGNPYECRGYRLPTEAEWEYAARAGTATATYNGNPDIPDPTGPCAASAALDTIAWYCANSSDGTHQVGTMRPNQWGLYDMLGNVYEWCHDTLDDYPSDSVTDPEGRAVGARVQRGGAFQSPARYMRSAHRSQAPAENRHKVFGFRVVRTLDP